MDELFDKGMEQLIEKLINAGLGDTAARWLTEMAALLSLLFLSFLIFLISWKIMRSVFIPIIKKSKTQVDDLLLKHKFFRKLSFFIPAIFLYFTLYDTLTIPSVVILLQGTIKIIFVLNAAVLVSALVSVASDFYHMQSFAKNTPLFAVFQVLKIFVYLIGLLIIIGYLTEKDISSMILSLGAMSAILLLIFKDSIIGLAAGFNLIFNKMVAIGDWIEMPKYGADGDVLEVNLTNVKIQNFDKTISTIPTYSLVSDSFKNWRGMEQAGARRIKRCIYLDMNSIAFCDDNLLNKLNTISILKPYLDSKAKELNEHNEKEKIDQNSKVNGRRQTNIGIFRAYLGAYLKHRNDIRKDMTFLIRQLQITEKGLPLEIYVFANTIDWAKYEGIQADIFDHVIAAVPEFGLRIFQNPTSFLLKSEHSLN